MIIRVNSNDSNISAKSSASGAEVARGRRPSDSRARLLAAARKLFVARGYHDTRPQDISRDAGLGHGTFYLHFPDKRACFFAFQEEACNELDTAVRAHIGEARTLADIVRGTLNAIFDYAEAHPHVLPTAMADDAIISAAGGNGRTLVDRWSDDWAAILDDLGRKGLVAADIDKVLAGHAVIGAIHQVASFGYRHGEGRDNLVRTLTIFLTKALAP